MTLQQTKLCSKCCEELPYEAFSLDKRATTGRQAQCRSCAKRSKKLKRDQNLDAYRERERAYVKENKSRVYAKNNRWREDNIQAVNTQKAQHYQRVKATPTYLENSLAYRVATKDRKSAYDTQYSQVNSPKKVAAAKAWAKENPDRRSIITRNYDANRRALLGDGISSKELSDWVSKQVKTCFWCKVDCNHSFHIDHYYPLSKGGKHETGNLVISCPTCNVRKNAKDPQLFKLEQDLAA